MDLRVQHAAVTEIDTPLLVVSVFEGSAQLSGDTASVDNALGGQISQLIADGEISGEPATVTVIHTSGGSLKARRVAVVGLGKPAEFEVENLRVAAALAARKARDLKLDSFATVVHAASGNGLSFEDAARAVMESSILALYRYEQFKEATKSKHEVKSMTVVASEADRQQLDALAELTRLTCAAVPCTSIIRRSSVSRSTVRPWPTSQSRTAL